MSIRTTLIRKLSVGLTSSLMVLCASAFAAPLTYHIAGSGSGSLNGTSFSNSSFEFFLTGEATNYINSLSIASVTIAGLGSTTLFIPTRLGFCGSCSSGAVFFSRADGFDLFDFHIVPPTGWSFAAPFSPLSGSEVYALNQFIDVPSSGGLLTFSSSSDVQFWAAPVPEPETYAMMLAGLGLIGGIARRKKQLQASS